VIVRVFPYAVAIGELLAGLVYLRFGQWRLAIVWFGVGVANFAFAGIL
jgi:hypothetical protein